MTGIDLSQLYMRKKSQNFDLSVTLTTSLTSDIVFGNFYQ